MIFKIKANMEVISEYVKYKNLSVEEAYFSLRECFSKKYNITIQPNNQLQFIKSELFNKARFYSSDDRKYETVIIYNDTDRLLYMSCDLIRDYDLGIVDV